MYEDFTPVTIRIIARRHAEWERQKEELGMGSTAEYVRSMVAAGRSYYSEIPKYESPEDQSVRKILERELRPDEFASWDELVDAVMEVQQEKMEKQLHQMRENGKIEHSPRSGGWRLDE